MSSRRRALRTIIAVTFFSMVAAILAGVIIIRLLPAPKLLEDIPFSSVIFDRQGVLLRVSLASDGVYRIKVPLADVSAAMIERTLAYEDRWFYQHPGVNPAALVRAAWQSISSSRRIGASTITMQVARLRYRLNTRTVPGKLRQLWLALRLEAHYDKAQILEAYFNLAPYGGNIEGVEAASRIYFARSASALSLAQCLALSIVPQNPVKRNPLGGTAFDATRLREAQRQVKLGLINKQDIRAFNTPLQIKTRRDLPFLAPHFTQSLMAESPGKTIHSTLSLSLNQTLERMLSQHTKRLSNYGIRNGAIMVLDSTRMQVLAQVGSADFFNKDISGEIDGTAVKRSPGSTLKPFIYALALEQGLIHSETLLIDTPSNFAGYRPENADQRYRGPIRATQALQSSRNVPAIYLASRIKPDLWDFLHKANVPLSFDREHYGLSLALGSAEISMNSLVELYAMLANQGVLTKAVRDINRQAEFSKALLSPEAAWITQKMLEHSDIRIKAGIEHLALSYKTGTSNGFRDAWCIGIAGPYVIAVWFGHFDNKPNPYLVGADLALPLFRDIVSELVRISPKVINADAPKGPELALHSLPLLKNRTKSIPKNLRVTREFVCRETGDIDISLCPNSAEQTQAWFIAGKSPTRSTGILRKILVNTRTGLRACHPKKDETKEEIRAFWPTQYQALFLRAGMMKTPPPPWEDGCENFSVTTGKAPEILSPNAGVVYFEVPREKHKKSNTNIILRASCEPDVQFLYWFEGARYLGVTAPNQALIWQTQAGRYRISVVDDQGRSSTQHVSVERNAL